MEAKKTATISKQTMIMVCEWARQQGIALLTQMEKTGVKETISLHWPMLKGSWLGGFVSGVQSGFKLGLESAKKIEAAEAQKTESIPEQLELPV